MLFALEACSSGAPKPLVSASNPGIEGIKEPKQFEGKFCTMGTNNTSRGIVNVPDEKQYAIGKCRHPLFNKKNVIILRFGNDDEISSYADAEMDLYLHPGEYMDRANANEVRCAGGKACDESGHPPFRGALVYFDSDSAFPLSITELQRVAKEVQGRAVRISIIGHADNSFTEEHNMPLSQRRAAKVKTMLVALGVPSDSIVTEGRSSREPVASNDDEEGRAKNRRTEVREVIVNEY